MKSEELARALPHNPEAERSLLCSMLINPTVYWRVEPILAGVSDFRNERNQSIFAAVSRMSTLGTPVDILTVRDELKAMGDLDAEMIRHIGDTTTFSYLPDIANAERYAEIVAKEAKRRRLIDAGNRMMRRAMEGEDEPEAIAADAISELLSNASRETRQLRHFGEIVGAAIDLQQARLAGTVANDTLVTGFPTIDAYRAVRRGALTVLGAPSEHGKSAFALNCADGLASRGSTVAIFTLESTEFDLALRQITRLGRIPHSHTQDFRLLTATDREQLDDVRRTAMARPIYVTRHLRSIEEIYAECRRAKTLFGLDAVFIDYAQIIHVGTARMERQEQLLASAAQRLLEMSIELDIAVVALSQLNEDRKSRAGGRLSKSDLKYAKAIGESARVVLLFQRPAADDKSAPEKPCYVNFQIEKNNENRTGDLEMHFSGMYQTFSEGNCEDNRCPTVSYSRQLGLVNE